METSIREEAFVNKESIASCATIALFFVHCPIVQMYNGHVPVQSIFEQANKAL